MHGEWQRGDSPVRSGPDVVAAAAGADPQNSARIILADPG